MICSRGAVDSRQHSELEDSPSVPMTAPRRKSIVANVLWLLPLLFVVYVLSYPIYLRCVASDDMLDGVDPPADIPGYRPVQWMIDETPLIHPIARWGGLFGASDAVYYSRFKRHIDSIPPEKWGTIIRHR